MKLTKTTGILWKGALCAGLLFGTVGCPNNDGPLEDVGESIDEAGEEIGDEIDDATDDN